MADERQPDAAMVPRSYVRGGDTRARIQELVDEFDKALAPVDEGKVWVRPQANEYFLTRLLSDTLLFATEHPRHPEERYTWVDRSDGVRYGYLKDEKAEPVRPARTAADRAAFAERLRSAGIPIDKSDRLGAQLLKGGEGGP